MMHGHGVYKWEDDRFFIGHYKDDRKEGSGIYLWPDNRAFNGNWSDGK